MLYIYTETDIYIYHKCTLTHKHYTSTHPDNVTVTSFFIQRSVWYSAVHTETGVLHQSTQRENNPLSRRTHHCYSKIHTTYHYTVTQSDITI